MQFCHFDTFGGFMSKQKLTKEMRKKRILPTLLLSLTIPLVLCVFIPLEIYGNNLDEFMFSLSGFLPMCFVFALLFSALIFVGLFFLPQKGYKVCSFCHKRDTKFVARWWLPLQS